MTNENIDNENIDYDKLADRVIEKAQETGMSRRTLLSALAGGGVTAAGLLATGKASAQTPNGIIKVDQIGTSSTPVDDLYVDDLIKVNDSGTTEAGKYIVDNTSGDDGYVITQDDNGTGDFIIGVPGGVGSPIRLFSIEDTKFDFSGADISVNGNNIINDGSAQIGTSSTPFGAVKTNSIANGGSDLAVDDSLDLQSSNEIKNASAVSTDSVDFTSLGATEHIGEDSGDTSTLTVSLSNASDYDIIKIRYTVRVESGTNAELVFDGDNSNGNYDWEDFDNTTQSSQDTFRLYDVSNTVIATGIIDLTNDDSATRWGVNVRAGELLPGRINSLAYAGRYASGINSKIELNVATGSASSIVVWGEQKQ